MDEFLPRPCTPFSQIQFLIEQHNKFLKPSATAEFSSEVKRIGAKQHGSSTMRAPVPPGSRTTKFTAKLKSKYYVNPSSRGFLHETNKTSDDMTGFQPRGYGYGKYDDESAVRRDELVRYMSNLPDYLQRPEIGEKIQEKALSVGVLDWGRLESWKQKQSGSLARGCKNTSCSSSDNLCVKNPSKPSTGATNKMKPYETFISLTSKEKVSRRYDHSHGENNFHQSVRSVTDFQDGIRLATEGQKWTPRTLKSLHKNHVDISLTRGKRADKKITSQAGTYVSTSYYKTTGTPQEHANDCEEEDEGKDTCFQGKCRNCKFTDDIGFSTSKSDSCAASLSSSKIINNRNSGRVKMVESLQDTNIDVYSEEFPKKGLNNVLLVSKKSTQTRSLENSHHVETRILANDNVRKLGSFSDGFAPEEDQFAKFSSEISNPIALPPRGTPSQLSRVVRRSLDLDTDFSSVVSRTSSCSEKASSLLSETTYEDCDESVEKFVNQHSGNTLREPLHEETAEMKSERSRNSSPNRRFSFSISRIGRSFSFKEGSSLPRFSSGHLSVNSGPLTVEASTSLDNSNKEKLIAHNRSRPSPFRRLLDPIWKHKGADPLHSAETLQSLKKGSNNGLSSTIADVGESLHLTGNDGSTVRAVLHHTVKNGLPFYKFTVNDKSSILVATVKNMSSCEKDRTVCNFTFHVVDEIKKKSGGWIGLGAKEKSCGYVYNVVGQMKDAASHFSELSKQCTKEYVLLGVETKQVQGPPMAHHSKELAAVVIRSPNDNFIQEIPHDINFMKDLKKCWSMEHCRCSSGECEMFNRMTVILPGGVHGSPNNGAPSPLIFRWKSGGSCDCGGWDAGCKLHVIHSQKQCFSVSEGRSPCALSGHLELYLEGRGEQTMSIFSMSLLKSGMHSVEFRSPISVLQAFFICVAVQSSQKSSSFSELDSMYDLFSKEPSSKETHGFHFQGNAPAKYTPNPPLSPVGRV